MVYEQHRIYTKELDEQTTLSFWDTNGSPDPGKTTRRFNNQQQQQKKNKKKKKN